MKNVYSTVGFCDLLFIVFLILKLTNVINWSWWWITAPLWGPLALALAGVIIAAVIYLIWALIDS